MAYRKSLDQYTVSDAIAAENDKRLVGATQKHRKAGAMVAKSGEVLIRLGGEESVRSSAH